MTTRLIRVGDVSEQIRGVSYGKEDASPVPRAGYLPVLRAGNITEQGLQFEDLVFVPAARISVKQRVRKDDLVIAASSGSLDVVGKAARALSDFEGGFGAFCKVLRPTINKINPAYFSEYFRTPGYRRRVSTLAAGANINNLRSEHLDGLLIPLPSASEQQRIATILHQADALRAKRRATLALLDSLTSAVFLEMFGDPVSNSKAFPISQLADLGTVDRGVSRHRPRNSPELLGGPHPLIQTGEIANSGGYIDSHSATYSQAGLNQSKLWPAGTLCITIAANIAKTGILTFDACFPDSVVGFRSDPATVEYVRVFLSFVQKALEDNAPESAQKNINLALLRQLPIPVPPLDLRRLFARRISVVERVKSNQRQSMKKMDTLFAALQEQAFNSEL